MSDYIITIPDRYFPNSDTFRDVYYPDERHNPMPLEEIVYCRDCKHYIKSHNGTGACHPLGISFADMDDGYCAWAERRCE